MNIIKIIRNVKIICLLGAMALLTTGCEETEITTEVFPDGSCQRTVVIKSDSAQLTKDSFPMRVDDSWSYSEKIEEDETVKKEKEKGNIPPGKSSIYTAHKSFKHVQDMNEEFFNNPQGSPKVKRFVSLDKRFRGFYTFITYREVWKELNPFKRIALEEYFSKDEMVIVKHSLMDEEEAKKTYSKEKLDAIEAKIKEWLLKNIFEESYEAFVEAAKKVNTPGLTPETLAAKREELYKAFEKNIDIFEDLSLDKIFKCVEEVFPVEVTAILREQGKDAFRQLESSVNEWQGINVFSDYTNKVIMPGLITGTNAPTISGSMVSWKIGIEKYLVMDYEMWVESRIVNRWPVGVAGLLLLSITSALVIGIIRSRSR